MNHKLNKALNKTTLLMSIILIDLLVGMEFDLFVPSFPELQNRFNLSAFLVEALLSINFIGYCVSVFFVGALADRYGRKFIILLGLVIFIIGSVFCLCANSYYFLLFGRLLQGIGVAAPAILSFLIIADIYSMQKQQFLLAMLNGSMNTFVALSPVVGSYITLHFHWQGNFMTLLALGVITLIMAFIFVPHSQAAPHKDKNKHLFLNYLQVFQSKPLRLLLGNIIFTITPYWIFVGMSPLLYMQALGVSLSQFGYYQGALALVFALGSIVYGLMINRYQQKKMLTLSLKFFIASAAMIAFLVLIKSSSPILISLALLLFVIGQIVPSTIFYPLSLHFIPEAKGCVSAIIGAGRLILASLGLQLAGYCYQGSFSSLGIILIGFILVVVLTFIQVMKNTKLTAGLASIHKTESPSPI